MSQERQQLDICHCPNPLAIGDGRGGYLPSRCRRISSSTRAYESQRNRRLDGHDGEKDGRKDEAERYYSRDSDD
jgi:hypothetical protein